MDAWAASTEGVKVGVSTMKQISREITFPYSVYHAWKMDLQANRGNFKSIFVITWFRLSNFFGLYRRANRLIYFIGMPVWGPYRLVVDWIMSIEIPPPTRIGGGFRLDHGQGLVINAETVIGEYCILRHNTTLGCLTLPGGLSGVSPVLGNRVDVGSNAVLLGDIYIGNDAKVGAGSVVVGDVPEGATVVGNPARVIP